MVEPAPNSQTVFQPARAQCTCTTRARANPFSTHPSGTGYTFATGVQAPDKALLRPSCHSQCICRPTRRLHLLTFSQHLLSLSLNTSYNHCNGSDRYNFPLLKQIARPRANPEQQQRRRKPQYHRQPTPVHYGSLAQKGAQQTTQHGSKQPRNNNGPTPSGTRGVWKSTQK